MAKVERHFGICQACLGEFHVHNSKMVLHGYKRPGHGYIEGDCVGVGHPPYELSCELQKKLVVDYTHHIATLHKEINRIEAPSFKDNLFVDGPYNPGRGMYEQVEIPSTDPRWERKRRLIVANKRSSQKELQWKIDQWKAAIQNWQLRSVRSFEEIQEQVKAHREAAAGTRQRALEAKQVAMIANLQKRIDAALKGMSADYLKALKKGELDALWLSTEWGVQNRLKSLYEMVTSGLAKMVFDGKIGAFEKAADALGRPQVIRGLGMVDAHDALYVNRKPSRHGDYISLPEFGAGGEWADSSEGRRFRPGPTWLRAREGMIAYFGGRK